MAILKPQIEAIQTVIPTKPTDPKVTQLVSLSETVDRTVYQRRTNVILYYNKTSDHNSGWLVAGWIKESLGKAFSERPTLAGRLRREENNEGELKIVSNDSGGRLIEARIEIDLKEFVDSEGREEGECKLLFWEDVDEQSLQFYPLFYVQVTNFKCGGYAIGISCSLLLADPFSTLNFIKTWANIHRNMIPKTNATIPEIPVFYLPNIRKPSYSPTHPIMTSSPTKKNTQTMIFNFPTKLLDLDTEMPKLLALHCIEKAELKLGSKRVPKICLFGRESPEKVIVENYSRGGHFGNEIRNGFTCVGLDGLGVDEISFCEENKKPICVSCWIGCGGDEGLVMVNSSPDEGSLEMKIIVTIPNGY